jgi:hypothetical protein
MCSIVRIPFRKPWIYKLKWEVPRKIIYFYNAVADPEIKKKGGGALERAAHPLKIAKSWGIFGVKSWGLLILDGKFGRKGGGGGGRLGPPGPPSKSATASTIFTASLCFFDCLNLNPDILYKSNTSSISSIFIVTSKLPLWNIQYAII